MSNKIITSCKDCKFATFNNKAQTGCLFNLIDAYKEAGIGVIEAYDEDKEFLVIDRICMYSRHKSADVSTEDVLQQIKIRYQVVIILDNDLEKFAKTLNSISRQGIKPQHITAIQSFGIDHKPFAFTKLLSRTGVAWRFQDAQSEELSKDDAVNICIHAVTHPYYIVVNNGFEFPDTFSSELNDLINARFTQFTYLHNEDIYIVPTVFHKQLSGSAFSSLLTKIKEDDSLKQGIYPIGELIKCLC